MVKDFSATTAATTTVTTITTECVVMAGENNSHTAQNVAATIGKQQQLQNGQKQNGRRVEVEDECLLFCGRGKRQCMNAPEIANAQQQRNGSGIQQSDELKECNKKRVGEIEVVQKDWLMENMI